MSDWIIPLSDLDYDGEEESAVSRVLKSRWLSLGPEVQAFEREFIELIGGKYALAVANGTAALHLCFMALGLEAGDEIIQPAINFVAAANMTVAGGLIPIFADIVGFEEPTIDPVEIEKRIISRTKAVVVMHYGGYPCRMADIKEICDQNRLFLIEDACHAVGARYLDPKERGPHKKMAGSIGDIAAFSFFSNKNLTTGEGGMVVTSRDDLAERVRLLRSHGMSSLTWDRYKGHASSYDVTVNGYNYRFDELRAALGRCQLAKLEKNNQRRGHLVAAYRQNLRTLPDWIIPFGAYHGESAHHLMTVVAPSEGVRREAVQRLTKNRIQTSLHYPFLPGLSAFRKYPARDLERSTSFASRVITLPLYPRMTFNNVQQICECIVHDQR